MAGERNDEIVILEERLLCLDENPRTGSGLLVCARLRFSAHIGARPVARSGLCSTRRVASKPGRGLVAAKGHRVRACL